jgi:hypothetical protein
MKCSPKCDNCDKVTTCLGAGPLLPTKPRKAPVENWVMHVVGPDDVFPCRDELTALRSANDFNKAFLELTKDDSRCDVLVMAVAKNSVTEEV